MVCLAGSVPVGTSMRVLRLHTGAILPQLDKAQQNHSPLSTRMPLKKRLFSSAHGALLPNDLGLFDMLGNVNEWVHDRGGIARISQNSMQ